MHHRFQYFFHIQAGFCGNLRCIHGLKTNHILNFMGNQFRVCRRKIHLIDNRNNLKVVIQCKIGIGQRLRLNPLRCIHYKNGSVAGRKGTAHLIVKVYVPRCINQIKNIFLSVLRLIDDADSLRLNRDSAFPFDIHIVQNLRLHLPFRQCPGLLNNTVCQSGLSVINMRNNTKVPNSVLLYLFHRSSYILLLKMEQTVFRSSPAYRYFQANNLSELYHKKRNFSIFSAKHHLRQGYSRLPWYWKASFRSPRRPPDSYSTTYL